MRPSRAAAILGAVFVVLGCFPTDPGLTLEVRNDSARTVLIAITDDGVTGPVVYAPPGAAGYAFGSTGVRTRALRLLEADCTQRTRIITENQGWFRLTVAEDEKVSLDPITESESEGSLRTLSGVCGGDLSCDGAATPWPSEVPERPPMEWCDETSTD